MSNEHIGYKKCRDERIVVLEILGKNNEGVKGIVDKQFAEMRCSKARVIRIYNMHDRSIKYEEAFSIRDKSFKYTVGEVVVPANGFDKNLYTVRASGIHYFLTEEPAYYWKHKPKNGPYKSWYSCGQIKKKCTYKKGKKDGLRESWHENGQIVKRFTYKEGKKDGPCKFWDEYYQIHRRFVYKNGKIVKN